MNFKTIIIGLASVLAFGSCTSNKDATFQVLEAEITSITVAESAISDTDVKVIVNFSGPDGCSSAYNIKADKVGQTITLKAYYKHEEGGACTASLIPLTLDYSFFADLPGPFFFISATDNSVADTVVVY